MPLGSDSGMRVGILSPDSPDSTVTLDTVTDRTNALVLLEGKRMVCTSQS